MRKIAVLKGYSQKALFTSILLLFAFNSFSQTDTLHIYYKLGLTQILDSNEAKIGAWAKKLNGKHVDVQVLAYYEKAEFKKYSQERCDGVFSVLNRKARELITITSISPKKGEKSQRSTVDIIYRPTGAPEVVAEKKSKENVAAKEKEATKKAADNAPKEVIDPNYKYDTTYVNGEVVVKKTKIDKKQIEKELARKKQLAEEEQSYKFDSTIVNGKLEVRKVKIDKPKPEKFKKIEYDPNYRYDSTYVNGKLEIKKTKIKK